MPPLGFFSGGGGGVLQPPPPLSRSRFTRDAAIAPPSVFSSPHGRRFPWSRRSWGPWPALSSPTLLPVGAASLGACSARGAGTGSARTSSRRLRCLRAATAAAAPPPLTVSHAAACAVVARPPTPALFGGLPLTVPSLESRPRGHVTCSMESRCAAPRGGCPLPFPLHAPHSWLRSFLPRLPRPYCLFMV